jgi:hypothetical protein
MFSRSLIVSSTLNSLSKCPSAAAQISGAGFLRARVVVLLRFAEALTADERTLVLRVLVAMGAGSAARVWTGI